MFAPNAKQTTVLVTALRRQNEMQKLKCSPPLVTRGIVASRIWTRLMDHKECHSCGESISGPSTTVGCVYLNEIDKQPELQFAMLCQECAPVIEDAIARLGRAWE